MKLLRGVVGGGERKGCERTVRKLPGGQTSRKRRGGEGNPDDGGWIVSNWT